MLDLAKTNKISLRAQTKTHKTVEGGVLQVFLYKQTPTTYKQQKQKYHGTVRFAKKKLRVL